MENGTVVNADYVICACDTDYTFGTLLDQSYMPKELLTQYAERTKYPVGRGFQV